MNKINWVNGQSGGTPLSAENLNLMEDYIEEAIDETNLNVADNATEIDTLSENLEGTTIFEGSATSGNISFSKSLTNFKRVVFYGGYGEKNKIGEYLVKSDISENSQAVGLLSGYNAGGDTNLLSMRVWLNNDYLTIGNNNRHNLNGSTLKTSTETTYGINKIVGYKF